jgi:hypothetical protein
MVKLSESEKEQFSKEHRKQFVKEFKDLDGWELRKDNDWTAFDKGEDVTVLQVSYTSEPDTYMLCNVNYHSEDTEMLFYTNGSFEEAFGSLKEAHKTLENY